MASKRRKRRAECGQKHRLTKDAALSRATKMRRVYPGQYFDAYQCPHGDHWHVGHRPKKVRQAIASRRKYRDTKGVA
jgi:hypothetical protein